MRTLTHSLTFCALVSVLMAHFSGCGSNLPEAGPLPPGKNFNGLWDSNWGQIDLRQQGSHVHGRFTGFRSGSVSGESKGNLFLFTWTQRENRQWGRGYLKMSPDGKSLEGKWGYQKDYEDGGRWWANRAQR
jgi:hypothetical protein